MSANKPSMDHASPDDDLVHDDAPDLSTPEWQTLFASAPMKRGRPKADRTKISTTIRLDADIVDRFRSGGEGWQSRINSALRQWLETH